MPFRQGADRGSAWAEGRGSATSSFPATVPGVRIVSLLPSATEIVCAVGAQAELCGVSHECDYPAGVAALPALTRPRVETKGDSLAIDRLVRGVLQSALSFYAIDEDKLAALAPDVIVTQDLCEVCAVSIDDVQRAVARLVAREAVQIVSLRPTRLGHVWDDVERVGAALGRAEAGRRVRAELEVRVSAIAARARAARTLPRVATIEWLEPLMLGGTWMPELVELAGGEAIGAEPGAAAPTLTPDALVQLAPDVVLVKACGFTLPRVLEERAALAYALPAELRARARIYATDGNAFFNRSGPRLVESLEILAACTHPALFDDFASKHASVLWRMPA
jgi:iron complex transport system substrate-binding protein